MLDAAASNGDARDSSLRSPQQTNSAQALWEAALGSLEVQVSRSSYETWLRGTVGLDYQGENFTVGATNPFTAEWLQTRMRSLLERTLSNLTKHPIRVSVKVGNRGADSSTPIHPHTHQTPPYTAKPDLSTVAPNGRYTFSSFVVGECNQLAYSAALAVAQNPGKAYNPLFIHSNTGLGKTHLLHAIAHAARARGVSTLLATSEQFVNDFVTSLQEHRMEEFRAKYRSPTLLLIDDIQFICGKSQSEETLFHTFNALHANNCQIVIAADRRPQQLSLLEDRLASRFQWGLMVEILPPSVDTSLAILTAKAASLSIHIPPAVLSLLAAQQPSNIRQLEGALTQITALASTINEPITQPLIHHALPTLLPAPQSTAPPTPEEIIARTAAYFELPISRLTGRARDRHTVHARHIAMYLLRQETSSSLGLIARYLGRRDHTTVQYGVDKIASQLHTNSSLSSTLTSILRPPA